MSSVQEAEAKYLIEQPISACVKEEVLDNSDFSSVQISSSNLIYNSSNECEARDEHGFTINELQKFNGPALFRSFALSQYLPSGFYKYSCHLCASECTRSYVNKDRAEAKELITAHLLNHVESSLSKAKRNPVQFEGKRYYPLNNITVKQEPLDVKQELLENENIFSQSEASTSVSLDHDQSSPEESSSSMLKVNIISDPHKIALLSNDLVEEESTVEVKRDRSNVVTRLRSGRITKRKFPLLEQSGKEENHANDRSSVLVKPRRTANHISMQKQSTRLASKQPKIVLMDILPNRRRKVKEGDKAAFRSALMHRSSSKSHAPPPSSNRYFDDSSSESGSDSDKDVQLWGRKQFLAHRKHSLSSTLRSRNVTRPSNHQKHRDIDGVCRISAHHGPTLPSKDDFSCNEATVTPTYDQSFSSEGDVAKDEYCNDVIDVETLDNEIIKNNQQSSNGCSDEKDGADDDVEKPPVSSSEKCSSQRPQSSKHDINGEQALSSSSKNKSYRKKVPVFEADKRFSDAERSLFGVWNDHCYTKTTGNCYKLSNSGFIHFVPHVDSQVSSEDEKNVEKEEPPPPQDHEQYQLKGPSSKKIEASDDPKIKAKALHLISELRHRKPKEVMVCTMRVVNGSQSSYVVQDFYTCEICGKKFTAPNSLYGHYRGHAGIKPFKCGLCGQTFTRSHSLSYHYMIHNNTARFKCTFCDKSFRHPTHFKEHLNRHTGFEPYQCADCPRRFRTRNTYRRHAISKHNKVITPMGNYPVNSKVVQTVTWDK